jgi:Uma2 family endonuclease
MPLSLPARRLFSDDEYLLLERAARHKSELISGEIYAMAGASETHILITGNVFAELRAQFKGRPCRAYASDMRVQINTTGAYVYPDVTAVCGDPVFRPDAHLDTLTNPTLVVEVLSPSTEAYDRDEKAAHYRRLPSLREYVLVAQDRPHVEVYRRRGDAAAGAEWILSEADGLGTSVRLASISCELALAEVYDRITFAPSSTG